MSNEATFSVVTTGAILDGFDPSVVQQHLVTILRLKPEQAAQFFDRPRVVRKAVDKTAADTIRGKLARIGVAAELRVAEPGAGIEPALPSVAATPPGGAAATPDAGGLSLELVEAPAASAADTVTCPNCGHGQSKSEQCVNCGAWFHKIDATAAATPAAAVAADAAVSGSRPDAAPVPTDAADDGEIPLVAIAAAAGAALVGAWLWKVAIASFGYELGVIAWGIGAAIGFAAAAAGARGLRAGVICAVFALASIGLGKYWGYSAILDEVAAFTDNLLDNTDEFDAYLQEAQRAAAALVAGPDTDAFVREFMVERGFTEASSPDRVSAAELAEFREYVEPELRALAETPAGIDAFEQEARDAMAELSPWVVMREEAGLLDLVFMLLGIGTAFRLGSQMQ